MAMSISARLPRIGSPGTGRLDVGQQRVDPLVAGLAMIIPLADQRKRALRPRETSRLPYEKREPRSAPAKRNRGKRKNETVKHREP